jgi:hypothetical protein
VRTVADWSDRGQTAAMYSLLESYIAIPFAILVVFLVLVVIARPDRDENGDGLYSVYLSAVGVIALYLVLVFGATCVGAIAERVLVDYPPQNSQDLGTFDQGGFSSPLIGISGVASNGADQAVQTAVASGLLAIGAAIVLGFHLRRRRELVSGGDFDGSAAARVDRAYLAAVAFLVVVVGVAALGIAGYGAFRIIAPDVTGRLDDFERQQGLAQLLSFGALVAICIFLFRRSFWDIRDVEDVREL